METEIRWGSWGFWDVYIFRGAVWDLLFWGLGRRPTATQFTKGLGCSMWSLVDWQGFVFKPPLLVTIIY